MSAGQNLMIAETGRETRPEEVKVWDSLVRIFHWSLAGLVLFAFISGEDWGRNIHVNAGYAVLALVGFRIVWGFIGTKHARFSDFVYGPKAIVGHLRNLLRFRPERSLGHNPVGGAMIISLIIALLATCITGYLIPQGAGEEAENWVSELHEALASGTMVLAGLHVAGVIFSSVAQGENLVRAMITGKKRATEIMA